MKNHQLPERGEVYLEVQISITALKKVHQIHKLTYNSFPSGAYPETVKEGHLSQHILVQVYDKAERNNTLNTLSSLKTEYERFLME